MPMPRTPGTAGAARAVASERGWLLDLYDSGYADAYSLADQEPGAYTWWPDGDDAGGLRTDTQIISELLVSSS